MKRFPLLLGFLAASLVGRLAPQAYAQATLTTFFTNGPTANRINLVILSEGYTPSARKCWTPPPWFVPTRPNT